MLITAVIPTLNEEKFIKKCLSSLSKQCPKIDIIVVDGGSTDRTLEIAKRYTKKVYNLNKRGIGIARHFGAKKAKGNYIYMTDADAWTRPNLLNNLREKLENKNAVAITGPTKYNGCKGKMIQLWYYLIDKYLFKLKYGTVVLSGRNTLVKKDILLNSLKGAVMPNFWEDTFITFKLKKYGKFIYENDLYNFSDERRVGNISTIIETLRVHLIGIKEFKKTGTIALAHLPLTKDRDIKK